MLLQLGSYKFEGLILPQSWGHNYGTEYAQLPKIGRKPTVQMVAEKLIEHDLSVYFSDEFCNPKDEVNALQKVRRNGTILQLTGGDGTNYGRYVLTDINITGQRILDDSGYISAINASIRLLEYNTPAIIKKSDSPGLASNGAGSENPKPTTDTLARSISSDLTAGTFAVKDINSGVASGKYGKIKQLAQTANDAFQAANDAVQTTKKIVRRAIELQNSIEAAQNALEFVQTAAQARSLEDLYAANTLLEAAMWDLNGSGSWIAAFMGSRDSGN